MAVRWFMLAIGLCWLVPAPPGTARHELVPRGRYEPGTPVARCGGSAACGAGNVAFAVDSDGARMGGMPPVAAYRAVLECLFGPRFLFRNQKRLTPLGDVLTGGVRPAGAAPQTIAAVRSEH